MFAVSSAPPPIGERPPGLHTPVRLGMPPKESSPAIFQFAQASRSGGSNPAAGSPDGGRDDETKACPLEAAAIHPAPENCAEAEEETIDREIQSDIPTAKREDVQRTLSARGGRGDGGLCPSALTPTRIADRRPSRSRNYSAENPPCLP